jgi:CRP-like cAMP-binding protein
MNQVQNRNYVADNGSYSLVPRKKSCDMLERWRKLVISSSILQECDPETVLISGDTSGRKSFLVEDGVIALTHELSTGKQVLLALRSPGQIFGHSRHILKTSFELSAIALTPCVVRVFDSGWLIEQIRRGGEAGVLLLQQHASDLYESAPALIEHHCDASARLERMLAQLAAVFGADADEEMRVDLPLSDCHFASLLGISAQQFSTVQRRLAEEGRIRHLRKTDTWILTPCKA